MDPLGTSNWAAGTAFTVPGNIDGSTDGNFAFSVYANMTTPQNRSAYDSYKVNPIGPASVPNECIGIVATLGCPYASVSANKNNVSTSTSANRTTDDNKPKGKLPVRVFGNRNSGGWDYYTAFMNQSLMQRNNYGEAAFGNSSTWYVGAFPLSGSFIIATGPMNLPSPAMQVPGPLPLLGAGAAFGWSRRLRQRARRRPSRS